MRLRRLEVGRAGSLCGDYRCTRYSDGLYRRYTYPDTHRYSHLNSVANPYSHCNDAADAYADSDAGSPHAYLHSDSDRHCNPNTHPNAHSNAYAEPHSRTSHPHADSNRYADTYSKAYTYAHPDAYTTAVHWFSG